MPLNIVIDIISEGKTPEQVTGAIGDKAGKVAIINPYESLRPTVKVTFSILADLLRRVRLVRSIPFVSLIMSFSRDQAGSGTSISLQETSSLSRFSYNIQPNGIAGVKDGLQYMQDGKVSLMRLVV
jgi:hypothetical protein